MVDHGRSLTTWSHRLELKETWTRFLLQPWQLDAFESLCAQPAVTPIDEVAKFDVSIVTGANDFFTLNRATVNENGLETWAVPLLPRIRHASGLRYDSADHEQVVSSDARSALLDFSSAAPDPLLVNEARRYLESAFERGIPGRYKCRIRDPWFRVPGIRAGTLLLSKRSHRHPRLVVNEASVMTTDTIYRGSMRPSAANSFTAHALVAGFHSSVTLLGAELEGRSFGGGVLELVPSEIARLPVVREESLAGKFADLDRVARTDPENLIERTDSILARDGHLDKQALEIAAGARLELLGRRLLRSAMGDRSMPIAIEADNRDPVLAEVS